MLANSSIRPFRKKPKHIRLGHAHVNTSAYMLVIYSILNDFDISETCTRSRVAPLIKAKAFFFCLLGHIKSLQALGQLARQSLSLL